jgi:CRP-like cAMP-binding protein
LKEGDSFGELALVMKQPRSATVKAVRNTIFATLNKEKFDLILRKIHEENIVKKLNILSEMPFLGPYSKAFRMKVTCRCAN